MCSMHNVQWALDTFWSVRVLAGELAGDLEGGLSEEYMKSKNQLLKEIK